MCCCCPPAITALFCLWFQSGFSKGTVAGALTFFPPDPPLYKFERVDEDGNALPDGDDDDDDGNDNGGDGTGATSGGDLELKAEEGAASERTNPSPTSTTGGEEDVEEPAAGPGVEVVQDGAYQARVGQTKEKVKSPAQQLTERAKELRTRAKKRNARDAKDAKNKVGYRLVLDPRLSPPRFHGGVVEAVKVPTRKGASYCAAIVYRVPEHAQSADTRTIIYSHGNATDIGAMFPLQSILAHSLECNVVSYDYSGYGESGGVAMEANTYTDIMGVYAWTLDNVCNGDESRVVLYGQSVGSGPCCYLACREDGLGGMILHSPFLSGMRVLTPSR